MVLWEITIGYDRNEDNDDKEREARRSRDSMIKEVFDRSVLFGVEAARAKLYHVC